MPLTISKSVMSINELIDLDEGSRAYFGHNFIAFPGTFQFRGIKQWKEDSLGIDYI